MAETYAQKKLRESRAMGKLNITDYKAAALSIEAEKAAKLAEKKQADIDAEKRFRAAEGITAPKISPLQSGIVDSTGLRKSSLLTSVQRPTSKTPLTQPATPTGITADLPGVVSIDKPYGDIQRTADIAEEYTLPEQITSQATPIPEAITEPTFLEKAKGGIADIGKWASDPKISRALMQAGLSVLATEPRRVPYSNAEMLGKAGLTGIAAYDTEVAREAAAKEMARKAGLEGRATTAAERKVVGDLGERYTPKSMQEYYNTGDISKLVNLGTGKGVEVGESNIYKGKDGKFYRDYFNKQDPEAKAIKTVEVSNKQAEGRPGEGEKPPRMTEGEYKQLVGAVNARYINSIKKAINGMELDAVGKLEALAAAEKSPGAFASLLPKEQQGPYLDAIQAAEKAWKPGGVGIAALTGTASGAGGGMFTSGEKKPLEF